MPGTASLRYETPVAITSAFAPISVPSSSVTNLDAPSTRNFVTSCGARISTPNLRAWVTARDRKSTRLNSSHLVISYAVFCLKKKKNHHKSTTTAVTTLYQFHRSPCLVLCQRISLTAIQAWSSILNSPAPASWQTQRVHLLLL